MTVLLDTHAVLWFWDADPRLSNIALSHICDPSNHKFVSRVTPWEVAIKVSINKYRIATGLSGYFPRHMQLNNFEWLEITDDHIANVARMPFHHRDPFDRLIIAQALHEQFSVISCDTEFDKYRVNRIW